jgi:hypothetical protein
MHKHTRPLTAQYDFALSTADSPSATGGGVRSASHTTTTSLWTLTRGAPSPVQEPLIAQLILIRTLMVQRQECKSAGVQAGALVFIPLTETNCVGFSSLFAVGDRMWSWLQVRLMYLCFRYTTHATWDGFLLTAASAPSGNYSMQLQTLSRALLMVSHACRRLLPRRPKGQTNARLT